MKTHSYLILLSLVLTVFSACDKKIDLNLPDYDSKLVINGEFNTNSAISVEISKSIPILKESDSTGYLLKDASAVLYENNVQIGNLSYGNLLYNLNFSPKPGKIYRIEVSRSGMTPATVEIKMPDMIQTNAVFKDSVSIDNFGFPVGQLSLSFQDAASTSNYYQLGIRAYSDGSNIWNPLNIESNDPVFVNNSRLNDGSFIFSDVTFNGQNKTITIPIPFGTVSNKTGVDKFEISIKTFSDEYYRYLEQVRDYRQKGSTFDTDPIILRSNVTNGLGMVGGVYNSKDTLR